MVSVCVRVRAYGRDMQRLRERETDCFCRQEVFFLLTSAIQKKKDNKRIFSLTLSQKKKETKNQMNTNLSKHLDDDQKLAGY